MSWPCIFPGSAARATSRTWRATAPTPRSSARHSCGKTTRAFCSRRWSTRHAEAEPGGSKLHVSPAAGLPCPTVHLQGWIDAYLDHLRVERSLAHNTLEAYARDLNALVAHVGDDAEPRDLGAETIAAL